ASSSRRSSGRHLQATGRVTRSLTSTPAPPPPTVLSREAVALNWAHCAASPISVEPPALLRQHPTCGFEVRCSIQLRVGPLPARYVRASSKQREASIAGSFPLGFLALASCGKPGEGRTLRRATTRNRRGVLALDWACSQLCEH